MLNFIIIFKIKEVFLFKMLSYDKVGITKIDRSNTDRVIRIAKNRFMCPTLENEFFMQKEASDCFKKFVSDEFLNFVEIVEPNDYRVNDKTGICSYSMYRIEPFPRYKEPFIVRFDDENLVKTLEKLVARDNNVLNTKNMSLSSTVYNIGVLIGFLQLRCGQDGFGVKIVLGYNNVLKRSKLYMTNFTFSSHISQNLRISFDRIVNVLQSGIYPDSSSKYFKDFSNGYLSTIEMGDNRNIIENIVDSL